MASHSIKFNDPSLFIGGNYINGQWIESSSGKRFDVYGTNN